MKANKSDRKLIAFEWIAGIAFAVAAVIGVNAYLSNRTTTNFIEKHSIFCLEQSAACK